jgi:hypothetical protein
MTDSANKEPAIAFDWCGCPENYGRYTYHAQRRNPGPAYNQGGPCWGTTEEICARLIERLRR